MKIILALLFVLSYVGVNAAEFKGLIKTIAVGPTLGGVENSDGVVLVKVENHSKDSDWSSTCSSNTFWSFKFNTKSGGGKETYSLLLTAYTTKSPVVILGTGSCDSSAIANDVQDLYYTRFDY